jgi:ATP-dependent DNA helicase Rep
LFLVKIAANLFSEKTGIKGWPQIDKACLMTTFSKLNVPQREAIRYLDGPLLVIAGAGSGKTRVITEKMAYLIEEMGISAAHIAAITFTNKAAKEMLSRMKNRLSSSAIRGLTVSTFHSLGLKILRLEAQHLGYKPNFSILDASDAAGILSDIMETTSKDEVRKVSGRISALKNDFIDPAEAKSAAQTPWDEYLADVYFRYQETLKAYQAVDFDDLIRLPVVLFQARADVLERWQNTLRYLLLDEYQDTNLCQYTLIKLLAGARGMMTAVGDDDQSIYAWRGANRENLSLLQSDFPRLQVIKLEQNYRSSVRILQAANAVIANNPKLFDKKLWCELGMGDPLTIFQCKNEEHEAETVIQLMQAHKAEHRTRWSDYAILYRSNYQARIIEQGLRSFHVPYRMTGGQPFFDKAEIKTLLAYVKLIANPKDDTAFIRALTTPKRGVGNTTLAKMGAWASARKISLYEALESHGLSAEIGAAAAQALGEFYQLIDQFMHQANTGKSGEVLTRLCTQIGYEAHLYLTSETPKQGETKWKNVQELIAWLDKKQVEDGKNLVEMSLTIALMSLLDEQEDEELDAVHLSTLHASKGLEYPHVYLIGAEEGILPHSVSIENGDIEEERRLMYVGITRAKRSLTVTHCHKRRKAGEWEIIEPSRFINELPLADCRYFGRAQGEAQISKTEGASKLASLSAMLAAKAKPP